MAIKKSERLVVRVPSKSRRRWHWLNSRVVKIDMRCIDSPERKNRQYPSRMKFRSPEHLKALCEEYFASCEGVIYNNKTGQPYLDKEGVPVVGQIKPYTISGLALYLDITTVTLKRYGNGYRDELGFPEDGYERTQYSDVIRRARQRIEAYAEQRLYDRDGFNGSRFVLDNAFKWVSTKESADIENMVENRKLRREEFEYKKESGFSDAEDNNISITISRKET